VKQAIRHITVPTRGKGLYNCTSQIAAWLRSQDISTGLLTIFIQHTSASLTIQENADPDVVLDLNEFFERLVREDERWYRHTLEGADDMTSHIRSALTQTQLTIPVENKHMALGTWQGIYVFEHRKIPHNRTLVLHVLGE
jgi:secondary thiamine-phosphate synthase enzyme